MGIEPAEQIAIESQLGKGSTFVVTLPPAACDSDAATTPASRATGCAATSVPV